MERYFRTDDKIGQNGAAQKVSNLDVFGASGVLWPKTARNTLFYREIIRLVMLRLTPYYIGHVQAPQKSGHFYRHIGRAVLHGAQKSRVLKFGAANGELYRRTRGSSAARQVGVSRTPIVIAAERNQASGKARKILEQGKPLTAAEPCVIVMMESAER